MGIRKDLLGPPIPTYDSLKITAARDPLGRTRPPRIEFWSKLVIVTRMQAWSAIWARSIMAVA